MNVLILGGGGTLGAFSAGALKALEEWGWKADAFLGSSAGCINLLRFTVGGPPAAADFWTSLRWKTLLGEAVRHDLWNGGLLDESAFHARVDEGVDYEALVRDPRFFGFIVVDLEDGRVVVRSNRTERRATHLQAVAHASYSLPPLLPPVRCGNRLLADGGLLHNAPLDAAVKMGATQIVYLCNVQVVPHQGFSRPKTMATTLRYLDIFFRRASNVGFADATIVEGTYQSIPFLSVAPPTNVRLNSMLAWMLPTQTTMAMLVERGYASAREALVTSTWPRPPR